MDRLDPKPGEKILDVATGTGAAARLSRGRGATVIGTDFAPDVLQAARELNPAGDIDFRVADAESLPFADGEFDGVTSVRPRSSGETRPDWRSFSAPRSISRSRVRPRTTASRTAHQPGRPSPTGTDPS